jgi:hypothetical protein
MSVAILGMCNVVEANGPMDQPGCDLSNPQSICLRGAHTGPHFKVTPPRRAFISIMQLKSEELLLS